MGLKEEIKIKKVSKRDQRLVNRINNYHSVFDSVEGKEVLADLCEQGFIIRPTQVEHSEIASFINEGKRNLVLYILAQLEMDAKTVLDNITKNQEDSDEEIY